MIELDLNENGDAKVPSADLIGQALDFWVCLCLGQSGAEIMAKEAPTPYSQDWTHGGDLIQTHKIAVSPVPPDLEQWIGVWIRPKVASKLILPQSVQDGPPKVGAYGPTPLVAACRAFVGGIAGAGILLPKHYHETYRIERAAWETAQAAESLISRFP